MRILLQDLRYATRMLLKNPGFAIVAVLTLALGIGANTAIFSVLDSVLLRELPVHNPQELSVLTGPDSQGATFGGETGERTRLAYSEFQYLRDHSEVFSHVFAADNQVVNVNASIGTGSRASQVHTENVRVHLVSGDYFGTLGVKAAAGQVFTPDLDRARGGAPVAVISYAFWKQRFGLSPSALGRATQIRNVSFEIIGVSPPGFFGETVGQAPDVWLPITMADAIYGGRDMLSPSPQGILNQQLWLQVIGRRKPGITNAQANAGLNIVFKGLVQSLIGPGITEELQPHFLAQRLKVQSAARGASTLHHSFGEPLKFLMALVGLVLLIACANVANLLLARGSSRQTEFVMRLAVGADRSRLVRQLLTESLLLAMLGACAGILAAFWADSLLLRMVQGVANGPGAIQLNLQPDARVLAFTLLVALFTSVLFGLFPALQATKLDLAGQMKSGASGTQGA